MRLLLVVLLVIVYSALSAQQSEFNCAQVDWDALLANCTQEIERFSVTTIQPDANVVVDGLPTLPPSIFRKSKRNIELDASDFTIEQGRVPGVCPPLSVCAASFAKLARVIAYCTSSQPLADAKRALAIPKIEDVPVKEVVAFLREQCFPLFDGNCEASQLARFRTFAHAVVKYCYTLQNILEGGPCSDACDQAFRGLSNTARQCIHRPSVILTMSRFRPLVRRRRQACEAERLAECSSLSWRVGTLFTACLKTRDSPAVCTDECKNMRIASRRFINFCTNQDPQILPDENRARLVEIDTACKLERRGTITVTEEKDGKVLHTVVNRPVDLPGVTLSECTAGVKSEANKAPWMKCTFDGCKDGDEKTTMEMIFDKIADCTATTIDAVDTCVSRNLISTGIGASAVDMGVGSTDADSATGADGVGPDVVASVQGIQLDDGCTLRFRQRTSTITSKVTSDGAVVGPGIETVLSMEQCVKPRNITSTRVVSVHVRCFGELGSLMDDPDNTDFKIITCGCNGVFRAKTTGLCVTWDGVVRDIAYTLRIRPSNPEVEEKHGPVTGNIQQVRIIAILEGIHDCEILEWDPSITAIDDKIAAIDVPPFAPMAIVQPPSSAYHLFVGLTTVILAVMLLL